VYEGAGLPVRAPAVAIDVQHGPAQGFQRTIDASAKANQTDGVAVARILNKGSLPAVDGSNGSNG
jgi:hypothetical protein